MRKYPTKKSVAAGHFIGLSLGDIQLPKPKPTLNHPCLRKHRWVRSKFNRRCTRCGREEAI